MGCITLKGYTKNCSGSIGGIKKVVIYDKADLDLDNMTVTDGVITDLTAIGTGYSYDFLKDNSSWSEAIVGDGVIASVHFEPKVDLVFRRMSKELRNEIMELSKTDVVIFVKDKNSEIFVIGTDSGLSLGGSTGGQSGAKLDELNGETLSFTGKEGYKAYLLDSTLEDTLM